MWYPANQQTKNEKANKRQMKAPVCNLRQALLVVKTHPQKDSQAHPPQGLMPLATLTNVSRHSQSSTGPRSSLYEGAQAARVLLRRRCKERGSRKSPWVIGVLITCRPTAKLRPILLPIKWARAKLTGPAKAAFGAHLLAKQIVNVGKGVPHKKRLPNIAN